MIHNSIFEVVDKIVKHHRYFDNHMVHSSGTRVFDTLMRRFDGQPAGTSYIYEAEMYYNAAYLLHTYIRIRKTENGWAYDESTQKKFLQ